MSSNRNRPQIPRMRSIVPISVLVIVLNMFVSAQTKPERFWLAGRYDGNRVIIYFNSVKFNGTLPAKAEEIADPVVDGFFTPMELPANYIAQFLKEPDAESFALGDKYDLILDEGHVATVTLTKLVGAETDEDVGNDSYIGAVATVQNHDLIFLSNTIYAVRRHKQLPNASVASSFDPAKNVYPGLEKVPVRFDIQTKIVNLLIQQVGKTASGTMRGAIEHLSPTFEVQSFHLANGKLRYYAQASWNMGTGTHMKTVCAIAAWVSPSPELHILSTEPRNSSYDGVGFTASLVNVVDLGEGRTGFVVSRAGEDSVSTDLVEYRDGVDLSQMQVLQSISTGE